MDIIQSIILEFQPCSVSEIYDYLRSDFFLQMGNYTSQEWSRSKIRYYSDKLAEDNYMFFKFESNSGYKVRYGVSRFKDYLIEEPRYLKVKGYLKRCMYCGMPIYINDSEVFHFKYKCKQYKPQEYFKLIKVENFWAIITRDFVYGILEDLNSCILRLPGRNQSNLDEGIHSELWLINKKVREMGLIEADRLLSIKAEEYLV